MREQPNTITHNTIYRTGRGMGEGREGDWECSGCQNRNYAFKCFCNRCKQPRLFVDTKTPADSKWLPRIGDWICTGCTNNNYASREKCKKCGQSKDVAAMPAIAIPGASLPTYSHYFVRVSGGPDQKVNIGLAGNGTLQQHLAFNSSWSAEVTDNYGIQSASALPSDGNQISGLPYVHHANQLLQVPKGWRNADWICNCGFHNYSSRAQCKNCSAPLPPALVTKRLASDEFVHDLENKRLNSGTANVPQQTDPGVNQIVGTTGDPRSGVFAPYPSVSSSVTTNWQGPVQISHQVVTPLLGKGAKQWRNGDWMCTNCDNHNYASRLQCNRCRGRGCYCLQGCKQVLDAKRWSHAANF